MSSCKKFSTCATGFFCRFNMQHGLRRPEAVAGDLHTYPKFIFRGWNMILVN